jgi:ATP-binding cassette subfamily E protein 1
VVVVEHDAAILEFLSDFICILYGEPGAYGVVTFPSRVRDGINMFLEGYIPSENLRFRSEALTFKTSTDEQQQIEKKVIEDEKEEVFFFFFFFLNALFVL